MMGNHLQRGHQGRGEAGVVRRPCQGADLRFFFLMIRRPPRSKQQSTLFPYTTLFRSPQIALHLGIPADVTLLVAEPPEDLGGGVPRSEEHTSELQSRTVISYAVFC